MDQVRGTRRLERRSVVQISPEGPPPADAPFTAHLEDLIDNEVVLSIDLAGDVDANGTVRSLSGTPAHPLLAELEGANAHRGFRKRLDPLRTERLDDLALRRLLFDLPIATMIMMQAFIVRTPEGQRSNTKMSADTPGVNQCAGWVAGGEMLTLIKDNDGLLEMDPSPRLIGDDHLGDPAPLDLAVNATRRRRRYLLDFEDDALHLAVNQRDSYATPDGLERALHWWILDLTAGADDHIVRSISVDNGGLPWVECPSAAGSAQRLVGERLEDLETLVGDTFKGVTTCTHLNDTLAALACVPELLARS